MVALDDPSENSIFTTTVKKSGFVNLSGQFRLDCPDAIAVTGYEVFVANSDGNSVTELPG